VVVAFTLFELLCAVVGLRLLWMIGNNAVSMKNNWKVWILFCYEWNFFEFLMWLFAAFVVWVSIFR
jgi:hypothetical protein